MKTNKSFRIGLLIIIIGCNLASTINAQTAYLDAVCLKNYYFKNNKFTEDGVSVLERYNIDYVTPKNTFLNEFFPFEKKVKESSHIEYTTKYEEIAIKQTKNTLTANGIDITNILDGFSKFIVKRTKQELSIAFFEQFKDSLNRNETLKCIFPQTSLMLSSIDTEIYMYEAYIQTLKASFQRDLASLPSNLPQLIYNNSVYFEKQPELKAMLLSSFYMAQSIQTNQHPGMIIENYPVHYFDPIDKNIKASFQILQLISKSLRSDNDSTYWITTKEANKLLTDPSLFKIYLGLVMQQSKIDNVVFADGVSLYDKMNNTKYNDYSQYIYTLIAKSQQLESLIKSINKQQKDSLVYEKYYTTATSIIDLMRFTAKGVNVWTPRNGKKQNLEQTTKPYFDVSQTAINLAIDVNRKDYSSAIVNTASILKSAFKDSKDSLVAQQIIKYGTFMALVAQAKNSDEVAAAIEAVALPTGSARIKRESKCNVSLNAYCGLFGGMEKIVGIDDKYKINSVGVTAPIGISISNGKQHIIPFSSEKKFDGHWSHSIFISIIDIGALAAFRFSDNVTESVPNIDLKDIISPGIFYSIGIRKSPMSVNIGWQMGPLLRKVTSSVNDYSKSYSRFSLSLCVDIPILNFYTSSK